MDTITLTWISLLAGAGAVIWRVLRENTYISIFIQGLEKDETFKKVLDILGIKLPKPKESYEVRMDNLIAKFSEVSLESDQIIAELEANLRKKRAVVDNLEKQQKEIAEKIEELKKSPEFGTLLIQARLDKMEEDQRKDNRKGALRDYLLFAGGVLTPYLVIWIARIFGVALSAP